MASVFETVTSLLEQDENLDRLSSMVDTDPERIRSLIRAATPAVIGGVADRAAEPGGVDNVVGLLDRFDRSLLTDFAGFVALDETGPGNSVLDHLFGANQNALAGAIAEQSRNTPLSVTGILPTLAPVVMAAINARRLDDGLDAAGLVALLGSEKTELSDRGIFDFGWLHKSLAGVSAGAPQVAKGAGAPIAAGAAVAAATVGAAAAAAAGSGSSSGGGTATAVAERPSSTATTTEPQQPTESIPDSSPSARSETASAPGGSSDIPGSTSAGAGDRGTKAWLPMVLGGLAIALLVAWGLSLLGGGSDSETDAGGDRAAVVDDAASGSTQVDETEAAGSADADDISGDTSGDTDNGSDSADSNSTDPSSDDASSDNPTGADGATIDAEALQTQINEALAAGGLPDVVAAVADDGTVTLAGSVDSETAKLAVEAGIGGVDGVTRVDNRIEVVATTDGNGGSDGTEDGTEDGSTATDESASADADTLNNELGLESITFETASARITAEGEVVLNQVATYLTANPDIQVEIAGHTDSDGEEATNLVLSQARADAVLAYLSGKGVASERMTSVGYGETQPITTNDTIEGKAANRRIDFIIQ